MNIYGIQRARKAEVSDFVEMIRAEVVLGRGRAQTVCQTVISRLENFHPDFLYNFGTVSINIRRNRVSFDVEDRKIFPGSRCWGFSDVSRYYESVSAIKPYIKDVVLAREIVIPPPTNFSPPTLRDPRLSIWEIAVSAITRETLRRMRGKFKSTAVVSKKFAVQLDYFEKRIFALRFSRNSNGRTDLIYDDI